MPVELWTSTLRKKKRSDYPIIIEEKGENFKQICLVLKKTAEEKDVDSSPHRRGYQKRSGDISSASKSSLSRARKLFYQFSTELYTLWKEVSPSFGKKLKSVKGYDIITA